MNTEHDQLAADHLFAWSSALNLDLYDADPGPREVAVGGPGERRLIERREALLDLYARLLLVRVDADAGRLEAVADHARSEHSKKSRSEPHPDEHPQAELVAAELAERALRIVREAGADQDDKARQRLLAGAHHQNAADILGGFVDDPTLVADPNALAEKLDRIDRES